ncbi:hypothetical protein [Dactylosporangium sp. NPDC000521]|uniref:hypothetical protein n=1 Tax=Dactylosporangium sp. NPDC000521 TaxID=3363975 RepID=UPI0036B9480A
MRLNAFSSSWASGVTSGRGSRGSSGPARSGRRRTGPARPARHAGAVAGRQMHRYSIRRRENLNQGVALSEQSPITNAVFMPDDKDVARLLDWFAAYDALAERGDVEGMADVALFPLTVTTNDSAGECVTQQWDRATFVQAMRAAVGEPRPRLDNQRQPVFLNADLAVVVTDSTVTTGEQVLHMRYVDVMAKTGGEWRFTSMIQAGWGDMLRAASGA